MHHIPVTKFSHNSMQGGQNELVNYILDKLCNSKLGEEGTFSNSAHSPYLDNEHNGEIICQRLICSDNIKTMRNSEKRNGQKMKRVNIHTYFCSYNSRQGEM